MFPSATQAILESHIPRSLASLSHEYILPIKRSDFSIAFMGHGELCMSTSNVNSSLNGACRGNHLEIVKLMIARGADDWNSGLYNACHNGHREIVDLMIACGANDWNWGLASACRGGHREIVDLMIAHGANNWNMGLMGACKGEHCELIKFMIDRGADECYSYCPIQHFNE
jgi:hypothetical protein